MTKIYSMKNKHPERQPQKAISSGCSFQRYFSSSLLLVIHKRLVLTPASLQKERIPGCPDGCDYFQYYYSRRKSILDNKEKAPACLSLEVPELMSLPSAPKLYPILSESEYTEDLLLDKKNAKRLKGIMDERDREKAFRRLVRYDISARQRKNKQLLESWEIEKAKINTKNQDILTRYSIDQESDIAYMYLLLYVADTKGENFRGVYTGTETITIDLRKALPSVLLRPCAQHGWTVKRMGMYSDLRARCKILCKRFSTKSRMALESRADSGLNPLITESHGGQSGMRAGTA